MWLKNHKSLKANYSFIFVVFIFLLFFNNNAFANTLVFDDTDKIYNVASESEFFEDNTNNLTIKDIANKNFSTQFISNNKSVYNFGFTKSTYWIRFKVEAKLEKKLFLELAYPPIDNIELYIPDNNTFIVEKSGDAIPFVDRKIKYRNFIFDLPIKDNYYYLKINSESSVIIPLSILTERKFIEKERQEQFIFGLYYGIVFTILIYNLVLFLSLREKDYLFYAIYVFGYGLFQMSLNGVAYEVMWSTSPLLNSIAIPFFGFIAMAGMSNFTQVFLEVKKYSSKLEKIFKVMSYLSLISLVLTLFIKYVIAVKLLALLAFIVVPLMVFSGFLSFKNGIKASQYFIIAWFTFLIAVILFALKSLGFLPDNFITTYGIQIGSAIQMILISFAIGARINEITFEKELAQARALDSHIMAVESLKKVDKLKDEFLANTSHELKTPLNGIIGITESLIDGATGALSPKTIENLAIIVSSGKRLANLVNDILDFSKLKNKDIELNQRSVDIRQLAEITFILLNSTIKGKNLILKNEIPFDISFAYADEERFEQILHNVIGNAVKFTEEGEVSISAIEKDDWLEITISDTGIGIPKDKIQDIFKPFEQIDSSTSRRYGGTGIGLTITKQLIELHGGIIRVESEENKGTKFTFTLPVSKEKNTGQLENKKELSDLLGKIQADTMSYPESKQGQELPQDEKIHILIVDDEPINLKVLINHLSLQNYHVTQASSGFEALKALETLKPDLILLDIMMPGMSGYEVSKKVRALYPSNELPIVMLTAKNRVGDLIEGFESGANDYLTKPVSKGELLSRIKTHVQISKINNAYGRFIPKEFINFLKRESIINIKLGDQVQQEMTIMFSDIRSFSSISEKMSPEENFNFINSYLSRVSPSIRKNKGFIDKYLGDGIMALFPDKAEDAIRASISMIKELEIYNKNLVKAGIPEIKIGIGLHTGNLMLGTVGEEERMEGTVISDSVNLASRLEGLNKVYGSSIIVSSDTLNKLVDKDKYEHRFLGLTSVKGKTNIISIFEIFEAEKPDILALKSKTKKDFEEGIRLYQDKKYFEAFEKFKKVLKLNKDDKACNFYIQECTEMIRNS